MHTYTRIRLAALGIIGLMILLLAAPVSHAKNRDDRRDDEHASRGIRAVLAKLDAIETRIVGNAQRLDELSGRMSNLERDVQLVAAVQDGMLPCTPGRFRAGKCNPLTLTATACADLSAGGSLGGTYQVSSNVTAELGVGWDTVLDANLKGSASVPIVLTAPGPIPVPIGVLPTSLELSAQGAAGVGLQVCMEGIELGAPPTPAGPFAQDLVDRLETGAAGIRASLQEVVADADVAAPARLQSALDGLRALRDSRVEVTDPLAFFKAGGPLRNLADALPVGTRITAQLDDPGGLLPTSADVSGLCDSLDTRPHLARIAGVICDNLDHMPQLELVTRGFERIEDIVDIVDNMQFTLQGVEQALALVPTPPILPRPPGSQCPFWVPPRLCRR